MNNIIDDRYQIINLLGEGGSGKTFQANCLSSQKSVAIKILSLRRAQDWKTIELFEREAKILAQLNHPQIPKYLDFFRTEIDGEDTFCIVQEIAPGRSLSAWQNGGHSFTEIEVKKIARQILEIVTYLQSFSPPIVHRDLKPQNILMTESGTISLVDFGAVRDTYHLTITGGSTIVGTYGYMAPEQFAGRAVLATDLYGLGATLVYLLTGEDPGELPQKQMKIDFRDRVKVTEDFGNWLERLLEPIPEDRFANADIAIRALDGDFSISTISVKPKYTISQLSIDDRGLKIIIPAVWFSTRSSKKMFSLLAIVLTILVFFIWLITAATVALPITIVIMLSGTIATIWLWNWLPSYLWVISTQQEISIDDREITCREHYLSRWKQNEKNVPREYLTISCEQVAFFGRSKYLKIQLKSNLIEREQFRFGQFLDPAEQRWLCCEIDRYSQERNIHNSIG